MTISPTYQTIFFDLDGTISDSLTGIRNGINFACDTAGIERIPSDDIRKMIGIPLTVSLSSYCQNNKEKTAEAVNLFRQYYSEKGITECELYPGIKDLLAWASDVCRLYVVTAKPTLYATRLLEHLEVAKYFTEIKGCGMNGGHFSKSVLIREIGNHQHSIIIGDKKEDVLAGKECDIKTCGVLYGYGTEMELRVASPDFIVSSAKEMREILS
jgi:phosphoglycolate phosphatase